MVFTSVTGVSIPEKGGPTDERGPGLAGARPIARQKHALRQDAVIAPLPPFTPTEALKEIERTLPVGVELHRSYHYVFPLGKQKKLDLLVLKIHCPDELEGKLNSWRSAIAERIDPCSVLVKRVRGTEGILKNLRNTFRGTSLITSVDLPKIGEMIESLCGKPPAVSAHALDRGIYREDLTAIPWIAPDAPGVRDIEDLIHAERKQNGVITFRVAFIDATDEVSARSDLDKYAIRVGSSHYGKRRTISTLPPELAHNRLSFVEGHARPAWVIEGNLIPNVDNVDPSKKSMRFTLSYRIRRANVVNHRSIDPNNTPTWQADSPYSRSLSAAAQAARILRHLRAAKTTPIRVDGAGGPLAAVTAELMIESKRLLTEHLGARAPMIYRVHQRPSTRVKEQFHRSLNALGIPNHVQDFDNPSQFAGILTSLEDRRDPASQAVLNDMLDTFLLRTLYSTDNSGHFGLRLKGFAEWKPRDASGLTNQLQLDAVWRGEAPLSLEEVLDRTNLLNKKRWARDEKTYNLRFLEMLEYQLPHEGDVGVGTVTSIDGKPITIDVGGFSRWGVLKNAPTHPALDVGSPVTAKLVGFDLGHARFLFEEFEV